MIASVLALGLLLQGAPGGRGAVAPGVVTGQILTREGTPATFVRVAAIPAPPARAREGLNYYVPPAPARVTQTDDQGRYRLTNLTPGDYLIAAGLIGVGTYYPDDQSLRFLGGFTENKNVNSPWLARAAVREAMLHGVDWIKIYTTQDFVGPMYMWKPDATLVASPSLTSEEVDAIVDEAHRLGLKVACHTYGGEGMFSCLNAGVDAPNHLLELDEAGVKILLQKRLPFVVTLDDLIALEKGDLEATGGKNSRLRMAEQAFKRARAAGVPIVYGSGATSDAIPHGKQADQFEYYVRWGMTPAQALQTAFLPAAEMLNYGWANHVGSLEKGKFADVIAVSGDPLQDVSEVERVKFVMKGGMVVRDELSPPSVSSVTR